MGKLSYSFCLNYRENIRRYTKYGKNLGRDPYPTPSLSMLLIVCLHFFVCRSVKLIVMQNVLRMGVRLSVEVNRKDRSVRGTAELKGFTFVMV